MNRVLTGRSLLAANAVVVMLGAVVADLGRTHMRHPRWPPHTKCHDVQTTGLGAVLGVPSLWFT